METKTKLSLLVCIGIFFSPKLQNILRYYKQNENCWVAQQHIIRVYTACNMIGFIYYHVITDIFFFRKMLYYDLSCLSDQVTRSC